MNYQELIKLSQPEWQEYTKHDFIQQVATGKLNKTSFLHYLQQDFLFIKHYARAYALAIYKNNSIADMQEDLSTVDFLLNIEIQHHIEYCEKMGITIADIENTSEEFGTIAYTRYFLDRGVSGSLIDLYVALAPCPLGYAEIGAYLLNNPIIPLENNPYKDWILMYGSDDFQAVAQKVGVKLNHILKDISANSFAGKSLAETFKTTTRMETAFWQQSLNRL